MTAKSQRKRGLTSKIFIALILGMVLGIVMHYFIPQSHIKDDIVIDGIFYILGQMFIRAMQMLVVPLVFFSIADGCRNMAAGRSPAGS